MSSVWEWLGFKNKSEPEKKKIKSIILQDYRVYFKIVMKGKPALGKIEGQAIMTAESVKKAEEDLRAGILEQLEVEVPSYFETKPIQTVRKEN